MSAFPYLVTKFTVPPLRATMVSRSSLISRLETRAPLVLLAAGAGFGKTTLLAAWAKETQCEVAWLTLDEQDNDQTRFWDYVLFALQTSVPALAGAVARLRTIPPSAFLTSLLNEVALHAVEVALILDDYHLIDTPAIHQSLAFMLTYAPACLRLILATRVEPNLPLPRLRARGHLVEIREADLRLNAREAECFLMQTMDLQLQKEEVLQLWRRTEGWIAGLQLVALSLRTQADPSAWVLQFRGSHRILLDYIQEEILEREPLSIQRFLLRAAVPTRMTAALCQQLCGEEASQDILEALVRANLFVVPLDDEGSWYRLHPLFREALLARLQALEPELVPLLHKRASTWYAEQSMFSEAIPHALAAHDVAWAAELIEKSVVPQNWRNEYHTLSQWLGSLPQEFLRTSPNLSLLYAQAIILTTPGGPGTLRLFLEEGQAMETWLKRLLPDLQEGALANFVRTLLHTFVTAPHIPDGLDALQPAVRVSRLSPQEHRVLALLAKGASNQEIASTLVIGLSTAKKHVAHLFRKLGAVNRTQAVTRAQEEGLL